MLKKTTKKKFPPTVVSADCSGDKNGTGRPDASPADLVGRSVIAKHRNRIVSAFELLIHLNNRRHWGPVQLGECKLMGRI